MNNKFNKNDKILFHAFVIVDVVAIITAVICILGGIGIVVSGVDNDSTESIILGVVIIIFSPISALIVWIMQKVVVAMYCDVKLIRNKLYNINNNYLVKLIDNSKTPEQTDFNDDENNTSTNTVDNTSVPRNPVLINISELKALKGLLDEGVLTLEEFETEKKKLMT